MGDANKQDPLVRHEDVRHETKDINFRNLMVFAGALIALAVVIHIVLYVILVGYTGYDFGLKLAPAYQDFVPDEFPQEPRLESLRPPDQLGETRPHLEVPDEFGWVERERGLVKIPVETAMKIIVDRLPVRPPQEQDQSWRQDEEPPSDANSGRIVRGGK
jgi:hypothetical protein